jgi:hypothetical protein
LGVGVRVREQRAWFPYFHVIAVARVLRVCSQRRDILFGVAFGGTTGTKRETERPKNTHWGKKRSAITLNYSFFRFVASSIENVSKQARAPAASQR